MRQSRDLVCSTRCRLVEGLPRSHSTGWQRRRLLLLPLVWRNRRPILRLYLVNVSTTCQVFRERRADNISYHQLGPDRPVWITEFACTNWNKDNPLPRDHVESFAKDSVKYLDTLDWVERYAWFGPMRDTGTVGRWARMLDDEGKLTPLGKAYRDE